MAEELQDTITQCGLVNIDLGDTYIADRLNKEGQHITSALDHIYMTMSLEKLTTTKKTEESCTDHVAIVAEIKAFLN